MIVMIWKVFPMRHNEHHTDGSTTINILHILFLEKLDGL